MPYKVKQRKDKWVVINTQTGEVKGTHRSKAKAMSQMRALYANEDKAK